MKSYLRNRLFPAMAVLLALAAGGHAGDAPAADSSGKRIFGQTRESEGAVTVALTPEKHDKGRLSVRIEVNTHTVNDLGKLDLKKIATLRFDGETIAPESAPKLGGHHTSGKLVFPVAEMPRSFSIAIRGMDEPDVREFSWP
jgi:hypothetical protein